MEKWLALASFFDGRIYKFGDANLDGNVDSSDLNTIGLNLGESGVGSEGDFNLDGDVDNEDVIELGINWGHHSYESALSSDRGESKLVYGRRLG